MTSNMGTREIKNDGFGFGSERSDETYQRIRERVLDKVQKVFSPELINRMDESIVFHPLTEQNVYDIINLQLSDLIQNLSKLGLGLKLTKSAKILLAKKGYDPKNGVRPLRRQIQKLLEDPISEILLKQAFMEGTTITVKTKKNNLYFDFKLPTKSNKSSPKPTSK